jgi:hypothetical protein
MDRRMGDPRAGLDNMEKRKILDPTGTRTPSTVIQSVGSCYTDCTTAVHLKVKRWGKRQMMEKEGSQRTAETRSK